MADGPCGICMQGLKMLKTSGSRPLKCHSTVNVAVCKEIFVHNKWNLGQEIKL